ncbi:phosphoenolpyruvate synthase [Mucilaginibacter celer]|uniref:Prodigiosin synthesizing transferase PigC n=1 Tax=Mucilaginibacter celer TaxID=2305508 RepID=A0A494VPL2_9SPHI|nr:phosphoenolpyruvate synthase [Mucilaginibacter celer]AYL96219.1 phosphoenolpyruvate synthase [Mucilaginibacter celer]
MTGNHNATAFISDFHHLDKTQLAIAGGKSANLGELSRIEGVNVPDGFCVLTGAFNAIIGTLPVLDSLFEQLSSLNAADRTKINELGAEIRKHIEDAFIPSAIEADIIAHLTKFDAEDAFAIRSSATAEDLPTASFAGQQDTYLNIIGREAILKHISKCWASLFTERAIMYRIQNGFDHSKVQLAVVVQKMVFPQAAGVLFTADPVTSNRKIVSIDAVYGLGEAMVSGLVNADNYKVRNGTITGKNIPLKKLAVYAVKAGGTQQQQIEPERQNVQVLSDEEILKLEHIGRKIEQHFGCPQDIEWCLADGVFYIVQSRPITTLYPIPDANDQEKHVYISVGHQQMMTDAMRPLGLSLWQLTAARPMYKAGGRLFVDVADSLKLATGRQMLLKAMGQHDPLIKDALVTLIEQDDFIKLLPDDSGDAGKGNNETHPTVPPVSAKADPAMIPDLIESNEASVGALKQEIQSKSGTDLFDFIVKDLQHMRQDLFGPQNMAAIMAGINASTWINEKMMEWLGEKNTADKLSQSQANNVTSEMGLALLDVADVIRPYPEVIAHLQVVQDDSFLDELPKFKGGEETRNAIMAYLQKYGMRCAGEIDITQTRWSESPKLLLPIILGNIKNFEPGAGSRKFEKGLQEALNKKQELLNSLRQLPDGDKKAEEAGQMINQLRDFAGYREYPKYCIVSRLWVYKQALLREAEKLVRAKFIEKKEDVYYLSFQEFREAVHLNKIDQSLIGTRKEEHKIHEKLNPPRVITSDGEIITGKYQRENLPEKALIGLPVSAGIIEGRARVILNMADASLEEGDILVTVFTDPSWTPLFVSIKGLVTEVGGLMTHGAVIAREYGLPAVVGVENATKLIADGQRIRVNGMDGYVEIL